MSCIIGPRRLVGHTQSADRAPTSCLASSMSTANLKDFKEANAAYVKGFKDGKAALPPARKVAVVTCMDARYPFGVTRMCCKERIWCPVSSDHFMHMS